MWGVRRVGVEVEWRVEGCVDVDVDVWVWVCMHGGSVVVMVSGAPDRMRLLYYLT